MIRVVLVFAIRSERAASLRDARRIAALCSSPLLRFSVVKPLSPWPPLTGGGCQLNTPSNERAIAREDFSSFPLFHGLVYHQATISEEVFSQ